MAKKKATKKSAKPRFSKSSPVLSQKNKVILGSFLIFFGVALLIAFVSFLFNWQADQSTLSQLENREVETQNLLSKFGAAASDFFIFQGFGIASFALAFLIITTGIYFFFSLNKTSLLPFFFF